MADIVSRIRKLIELSKSNNSPEEAASAAALAADLMFRYQIGEGDLDVGDDKPSSEEIVDDVIHTDQCVRKCIWRSTLAFNIATAMGCKMYNWRNGQDVKFHVFGPVSVVQAVSYLFGYLNLEVVRLTEQAWAQANTREHGRTWKNNYALGVVATLRERLYAQREEQEAEVLAKVRAPSNPAQSTALALYQTNQERVEEGYKKLHKAKKLRTSRSTYRYSPSAYQSGQNAGHSITLGAGRGAIPASKARVGA